jgi:pyruvate kinase
MLCHVQVATDKGKILAYALDTKGPEIRTAMLKDGKDIMLTAGQTNRNVNQCHNSYITVLLSQLKGLG